MAFKPTPIPTSRLVMYRDVTLKTIQANRVYKRCYGYLSRKLYHIAVVSLILNDREVANKAQEHVRAMLTDLAKILKDEKERVDTIRNNAGLPKDIPGTDNPQKVHVAIKSPYDARFLQLILDLDDLVLRIGSLWMMEELIDNENVDVPYKWQQEVMRVAGRIKNLADGLRKKAKEKGHDLSEIENEDAASSDVSIHNEIAAAEAEVTTTAEVAISSTKKEPRPKKIPVAATA